MLTANQNATFEEQRYMVVPDGRPHSLLDLRDNKNGQPTGRDHVPAFVARSHNAPNQVLTDWRMWRALWQDARAACWARQHVEIHRWRLDAPVCA